VRQSGFGEIPGSASGEDHPFSLGHAAERASGHRDCSMPQIDVVGD
jgi:hypothetical protein